MEASTLDVWQDFEYVCDYYSKIMFKNKQPAFICSKLTTETLEKVIEYVQSYITWTCNFRLGLVWSLIIMDPFFLTFNKSHCVKSVQIQSFFWSVFSRIRTEYVYLRSKSPYSARILKIRFRKNSVFEHFSRGVAFRFSNFIEVSIYIF